MKDQEPTQPLLADQPVDDQEIAQRAQAVQEAKDAAWKVAGSLVGLAVGVCLIVWPGEVIGFFQAIAEFWTGGVKG